MATASRHARKHYSYREEIPVAPPPRRRRRGWIVALVVLVVLVWLLPGIVAHTPLFTWGLRAASASAKLDGTISVRSASLGWFSPVSAAGIEVRDAKNQPVLEAAELTSEKSLLQILCNLSTIGKLRLDRPKLTVALRGDGSNVEDVLARCLASPEKSSGRTAISLEIVDGSATVTDQETQQTWQVDKLHVALAVPANAAEPIQLEASAATTDPQQQTGRLNLALTLRQYENTAPAAGDTAPGMSLAKTAGQIKLQSEAIPLAVFQRLLARLAPQARLAGQLSTKIDAQWDGQAAGSGIAVDADLAAGGLVLAMPALGKDEIRLERFHAVCRTALQDNRPALQQAGIECDVGAVSLDGPLSPADILPTPAGAQGEKPSSTGNKLLRQTFALSGRLDLARLARMLPGTLRIREGMQITAGDIQLTFSSRPGAAAPGAASVSAGMVWQGQLDVGNLTATDNGRPLTWEKPVRMVLAAHETAAGPVIDNLQCESDFLKINSSGTPDNLAASASFNLKQLADQVGRFVDLAGLSLAGEGWAHFNWTRQADQQFEAGGQVQLRNFQFAMPQQVPWIEEDLTAAFSAKGRTDFGIDTRLDTADLRVRCGPDQLDIKLAGPVLDLRGGGNWACDVKAQGQWDRWPVRLRPWVNLDQWKLAGAFQLSGQAIASKDGVAVRDARLRSSQVIVASPWVNLSEPTIELTAAGRWDRQQQRCQVDNVTLAASAVSVAGNDLTLAMTPGRPWEMGGTLKYRADLARVQQWFAAPGTPLTWRLAGQLGGTAQLLQSAGRTDGTIEADVTQLSVGAISGQPFQEPRVHLVARGNYQHAAGILQLDQMELTSSRTLGAKATGQIAAADKEANAKFNGNVSYDLESLCGLLRPYLGPQVAFAGRASTPAAFSGPLSLDRGQAAAAVKWDWIRAYGFEVGSGELKTSLSGGVLGVEPLNVACNQGRLLLAPRVRLAPGPMELTMPSGPLAQQVQITPAMCEAGLKYIAPVLARATTAQGSFSIQLDGCRIPISQPEKGEVSGRFIVHSVEIGPGPLVRHMGQLVGELGQLIKMSPRPMSTAKLRRESVVSFQMVNGRVYHKGLELEFPDLTVRTYGSVGLDQTLAVMTEIPVPDKWCLNTPLGNALRGRVIRLPIYGTFSEPKPDRSELAKLGREVIGNAARNVLGGEVNKQLERLFGPSGR